MPVNYRSNKHTIKFLKRLISYLCHSQLVREVDLHWLTSDGATCWTDLKGVNVLSVDSREYFSQSKQRLPVPFYIMFLQNIKKSMWETRSAATLAAKRV